MKKILFIAVMLMTAVMTVMADNSSTARATLDKAAAKVNISKGATASFTISGGGFGSQQGTISIKGKKINARTQNSIVWYDGKTQWYYSVKNEEVNVSTPSASQQASMNPYHFLTLYKNGYTLSQNNAASGYQVHLTGKGKAISEMYILVDKNYNIKQVKMLQKGKWITINISNLRQQSFSDATFRFNAKDYPKAEVIDLR